MAASIRARVAQGDMPLWAQLERRLIDVMNETPELVMEKYVNPDGSMKWPPNADFQSIDGLDDMYESFFSWPLFYLLGGDEKFLKLSHREYDAITEQFTHYGCGHGHQMVEKEYEQGYDWMHQGEGYQFFYLLNLADPQGGKNRERACRYAGFYIGEDPEADNYDPKLRRMRSCYLGSKGAAPEYFAANSWGYAQWKTYYGLPFHDVPGCDSVEDMKKPEPARLMGEAMAQRQANCDTAVNLFSATMVMNAYLHTGDEKYKAWIDEYVGAWRERTAQNGGMLPDNVGPDGKVGSTMGGRWYGGYYGWTWPHGFYFLGEAMASVSEIQTLLHGDAGRFDWLRKQIELLMAQGEKRGDTLYVPHKRADAGKVHEYASPKEGYDCLNGGALTMPGKITAREDFERLYERDGWYEFSPMQAVILAHAYSATQDKRDLAMIRALRNHERPEWDRIREFYSKDQAGHEAAWLEYLNGNYDAYPEAILRHAIKLVYGRMKQMREEPREETYDDNSYLQRRNPVNAEALVQLTTGGLMPIYNGGLFVAPLRHFDAQNKRPGLPKDVAALVSEVSEDSLTVTLANTSVSETRSLVMEAGNFGEHEFTRCEAKEEGGEASACEINDRWLTVELEPGTVITLKLGMRRFVNQPAYRLPW